MVSVFSFTRSGRSVCLVALAVLVCAALHCDLTSTAAGTTSGFLLRAHAADSSLAFDDDVTTASVVRASAATASSLLDDDDDALELLADDDEFVGGSAAPEPVTAAKKGKKTASKPVKQAPITPSTEPSIENVLATPQNFWQPIGVLELFGLGMIVAYLAIYLAGVRTNNQIAQLWQEHFRGIMEEQFSHCESATPDSFTLQKESEYTYKMFASGRRFCSGMLATLSLQRRQDLLSILLSQVDLSPSKDTMTLEFALNEEDAESFVFAICKRKNLKKFTKVETDVETMTTLSKSTRVGLEKYALFNELPEIEGDLVNDRVMRLLAQPQVEAHFVSMHISDQVTLPFSAAKKIARFEFELPSNWKAGEEGPLASVQLLTRCAFQLVDRLGELRLSAAARTRSELKRKKMAEVAHKASSADRQEQLLAKKAEQRAKEKEIIEKDPTSDLAKELIRKREAKEAKAAKKAKGGNIKMMR